MRPALALLAFLLATLVAPAQTYTSILVFGDSLSDTGNVAHLTQSQYLVRIPGPFANYTDGRFTDGTDTQPAATAYTGVWIEQLASMLPNHPAVRDSLDGGTNYSFGYAMNGSGTSTLQLTPGITVNVDNLSKQVDDYFATHSSVPPNTLVVVWAGANDALSTSDPGALFTAAGAESAAITRLVGMGANSVLVVNVPPLGLTPRFNSNPSSALTATFAAQQFNYELSYFLALQLSFPNQVNFRINQLDAFQLLTTVAANPASSGLTDVTSRAQASSSNPDQFLFWDDLHPTTAGHHLLATAAAALLAGPSQLVTSTSLVAATTGTAGVPYTCTGYVRGPFSGSATLYDGLTAVVTAPLVAFGGTGGQADFTIQNPTAGTHLFSVHFLGDAHTAASYSDIHPVSFAAPAPTVTTTTLTGTGGVPGTSTQASFTATVTAASGTAAPTGTVTFFDGSTSLGPATLSGTSGLSSSATLSLPPLSVGTHSITAVYAGAGNFSTSTSSALSLTVQQPGVTVAANPTTITVAAGSTGTSTLTVTPVNGFSGSVQFSCTGAPANATCIVGSTPARSFSTPQTFTLTVTTNGTTPAQPAAILPLVLSGPGIFAGLAALTALLALARARRRGLPASLFTLLVAASTLAVLGLSGCGSSGHNAPRGTYTLTVTTTPTASSSSTAGTAVTTPLTLNIQ